MKNNELEIHEKMMKKNEINAELNKTMRIIDSENE
jgi:hypothetical protein